MALQTAGGVSGEAGEGNRLPLPLVFSIFCNFWGQCGSNWPHEGSVPPGDLGQVSLLPTASVSPSVKW
jgi:hypothetical protein